MTKYNGRSNLTDFGSGNPFQCKGVNSNLAVKSSKVRNELDQRVVLKTRI
jgi:hypothetical protein